MWEIIIIYNKPRWTLTWNIIMNDVWTLNIIIIDLYLTQKIDFFDTPKPNQ